MPPALVFSDAARTAPHPLARRVLLGIALGATLIGGAVLVLTALGWGHADVRGLRLEGRLRAAFLGGLALAVTGTAGASVGLYRQRPWGVAVLATVWPTFALVCLVLDRVTPAPGTGRPLVFYVLGLGLLPATLTLLLGRRVRQPAALPPANRGDRGSLA